MARVALVLRFWELGLFCIIQAMILRHIGLIRLSEWAESVEADSSASPLGGFGRNDKVCRGLNLGLVRRRPQGTSADEG